MLWKGAAIAERLGTSATDILTEDDLAILAEREAIQATERETAEREAAQERE